MAFKTVTLIAMCALLVLVVAQQAEAGPRGKSQKTNRIRRQVTQDDDNTEIITDRTDWTTCDYTTTPKFTCQDCSTRLICKPIGGIIKACNNPFKPYCRFGFCSGIPSTECA